jgi:hypothetical protein
VVQRLSNFSAIDLYWRVMPGWLFVAFISRTTWFFSRANLSG